MLEWSSSFEEHINAIRGFGSYMQQSEPHILWREVVNIVIPAVMLTFLWLFTLIAIIFLNLPVSLDAAMIFIVVSIMLLADIGGELYYRHYRRRKPLNRE